MIGLLSDSHGRADTTRQAVRVLLDQGAQMLLHLGDVGSLEVIDELVAARPGGGGGQVEAHLVFGNIDWDAPSMARYAKSLGVQVDDAVGRLDLDGRELVFLHGHDAAAMTAALAPRPAWLCHGHSHRTRDERVGPTHVINPGALFRARQYTVALLDSQADAVTFHQLDAR